MLNEIIQQSISDTRYKVRNETGDSEDFERKIKWIQDTHEK